MKTLFIFSVAILFGMIGAELNFNAWKELGFLIPIAGIAVSISSLLDEK